MFKHTLLINYVTGEANNLELRTNRGSGWSESFIASADQSTGNGSPWSLLLNARAGLLPPTVSIVGYRISALKPDVAATKAVHKVIRGTFDQPQAEPSLALQAGGISSLGNRLRLVIRGIPDQIGASGDLNMTDDYQKKFDKFKATLSNFGQLVTDLNATTVDIADITDLGVVNTLAALTGVVAKRFVNVLRTNLNGKRKGGKFRVASVVNESTFTLANWIGSATEGGRVRLLATPQPKVLSTYIPANIEPELLVNRKTGKPFFSFRGRR